VHADFVSSLSWTTTAATSIADASTGSMCISNHIADTLNNKDKVGTCSGDLTHCRPFGSIALCSVAAASSSAGPGWPADPGGPTAAALLLLSSLSDGCVWLNMTVVPASFARYTYTEAVFATQSASALPGEASAPPCCQNCHTSGGCNRDTTPLLPNTETLRQSYKPSRAVEAASGC
jgi:hypothetical protein